MRGDLRRWFFDAVMAADCEVARLADCRRECVRHVETLGLRVGCLEIRVTDGCCGQSRHSTAKAEGFSPRRVGVCCAGFT